MCGLIINQLIVGLIVDLILVHTPYVLNVFSLFFFNEAVVLLKSNLRQCSRFCFVLGFALHTSHGIKQWDLHFPELKTFLLIIHIFKQTR